MQVADVQGVRLISKSADLSRDDIDYQLSKVASSMQVAELFAALLGVGSDEAGVAVAEAGVLQRSLALVLRYPFNNILHAQVTKTYTYVIQF